MSDNISDTFARQLQQMRTDVLAQIRTQRGGRVGRAEAAINPREAQSGDRAQSDAERDLAIAIDERENAELAAIDAALQRIAAGQYGLCINCGADIPTARLHANPTALRCVACQGKSEHDRAETHPSL